MAVEFMLNAEPRTDAGKAASRRLRRDGRVPAVLYGGAQGAQALSLDHNELMQNLKSEAFRSRVLTVRFGGASAQAIVKDLQAHPFKSEVLHVDLQRVDAAQKIRMEVPLHFKGGDVAPGVKAGGVLSRSVVEVEIECLPKDLPEHLELDVAALDIGDALHLSDIPLPAGVAIVALAHDDVHEHDVPVASVHLPRVTAEEEEAEAQAAIEGAEAAPAADAKGREESRKGESAA
ncbi:MAG TPA: 50S ribosomal protein L25/general stress protein Ctc [Gammaproteobacteria bacterium]|nr:50S ribosomal protein L25/general stress protein Ctc [Gammaproteobacteria bacterium]